MRLKFLFAILTVAVFTGCSTDVDLNAPYDSTTVIFGILDAKQQRQFVKINRTYLGSGNNLEYAQIRDSLEYEWDEFNSITVSEIVDGNVVTVHALDSITIENKETDGIFYAPFQTVYYFDGADQPDANGNYLNPDAIYELKVDFKNKEDVSSETTIINASSQDVSGILNIPNFNWPFVQNINAGIPNFNDNISLRWNSSEDAKRYEYSLRFFFRVNVYTTPDHTQLDYSYVDSVDWKLGEIVTLGTSGGEEYERILNGASFYSFVASRFDPDPLIEREMGILDEQNNLQSLEFNLTIGNDELNTFISVNEPVTGIVQERPEYTNVRNGIGIFASKSNISRGPFPLNQTSREYLSEGELTSELGFCSPAPSDAGEDFSCP